MSENFEPCTLEEATHVEVGGNVYKFEMDGVAQIIFGTEENTSFPRRKIGIVLRIKDGHWKTIFMDCFPIFNIKPLKEIKREPREFVHIFRKGSSMSYPSWAENGMFRCVEISEEFE